MKKFLRKISSILNFLPLKEYRVKKNIMLPIDKGFTQIDHIIVSIYGVFIIETKNYNGWIARNKYSEQWTENIYCKILSSIIQNGRIMVKLRIFEFIEDVYIFIVAFSP